MHLADGFYCVVGATTGDRRSLEHQVESRVLERQGREVANAKVSGQTLVGEAPASIVDCRLAGIDAAYLKTLACCEPKVIPRTTTYLKDVGRGCWTMTRSIPKDESYNRVEWIPILLQTAAV